MLDTTYLQPKVVYNVKFIVIDYKKGNIRSVQKGLELAGAQTRVSAEVSEIRTADALILPGVGSFADASAYMLETGQMQAIQERIQQGVPFLGICLGMQLLFERGNEGMPAGTWAEGLGIFEGTCERIASEDAEGKHYKVPHVGWNRVEYAYSGDACTTGHQENGQTCRQKRDSDTSRATGIDTLFAGIEDGSHFYFTHSFQCRPVSKSSQEVLASTTHATTLPSAVGKENVFGVQFHPEKSSHKGLQLMKNFVDFVQVKDRK